MIGRARHLLMILAAAACAAGDLASPARAQMSYRANGMAASAVYSFDWTYSAAPDPGDRHWSSPDGVAWTETYPNGKREVQNVAYRTNIAGCEGVVTTKSYSPASETFIPEPGCPRMYLLFRYGDGGWRILGRMRSVVLR